MQQALLIYIIIQSLLFSVLLISRKKTENKVLIYYFVYLFLSHVFFVLSGEEGLIRFSGNEFLGLCYEWIALCNSAIVIFILYSALERPVPKPLYLLWLLPALHHISDYMLKTLQPDLYARGFYENWYLNLPFYVKILFILLLVWQLKKFNREIAVKSLFKNHSQLMKLYLGKYFIYFHMVLSSLLLLYMFFTLSNGRLYFTQFSSLVYSEGFYNMINRSVTIFFLLVVGYLMFKNPFLLNQYSMEFQLQPQLAENLTMPEEHIREEAGFSEEQLRQYDLVLNKLMLEDKVYLEPRFSLSQLSRLSSIPSRQLSRYILQSSSKNFKVYINGFRVLHAQKLLTQKETSHNTMYYIAFESGFNSESTFYKIFKEETGMTPKQYQEQFRRTNVMSSS